MKMTKYRNKLFHIFGSKSENDNLYICLFFNYILFICLFIYLPVYLDFCFSYFFKDRDPAFELCKGSSIWFHCAGEKTHVSSADVSYLETLSDKLQVNTHLIFNQYNHKIPPDSLNITLSVSLLFYSVCSLTEKTRLSCFYFILHVHFLN